jgi:(5-formylfuran-3-yl)methyl phosphate synthase
LAHTPWLLASVSGPEEAARAMDGGVDIVDIKNPREGSLGACPPSTLRAIVALRVAGAERRGGGVSPREVRLSAALGDAPNLPGTFALAAAGAAACGVDYLKVGLRGVRLREEALALLEAVVGAAREVDPSVRIVVAAYADAAEIGSLPPEVLPELAERARAHGCLVDTARKDGRTLLDHCSFETLAFFRADCRRRGLLCGLSGSLARSHIPRLLEIGPDLIGARGALCEGGREGRLDPRRLREFSEALRRQSASPGRVPGDDTPSLEF